jgi:hypothetical protein
VAKTWGRPYAIEVIRILQQSSLTEKDARAVLMWLALNLTDAAMFGCHHCGETDSPEGPCRHCGLRDKQRKLGTALEVLKKVAHG